MARPPMTPGLLRVVVFGCVGMALIGYDTGVVSGSLVMMSKDMEMDNFRKDFAVSATILLAALGSVLGIPINDHFGRRLVVFSSALLYLAGAIAIAVSRGYASLVSGRVLLCVGIGFASSTVPTYSAELSPPQHRGMVVALNNLAIVLGQLLAGIVNALVVDVESGWRISMGLAAVPAGVMLLGACALPESPRWLALQGRAAEAETAVRRVCGDGEQATAEVAGIQASLLKEAEGGAEGTVARLRRLWTERELRRALLLGMGLMALNQLSGISAVMYYAATLLVGLGFSPRAAVWIAAACCLAQLLGACLSVASMDRSGRRRTALRSTVGVVLALLLLALCFAADAPEALGDGLSLRQRLAVTRFDQRRAYLHPHGCPAACTAAAPGVGAAASYAACQVACDTRALGMRAGGGGGEHSLAAAAGTSPLPSALMMAVRRGASIRPARTVGVLALLLYLGCFGAGLGSVPWVLTAEIFPSPLRAAGAGHTALFGWLLTYGVAQSFLALVDGLRSWGAFLLYATFTALGGLWMLLYLPETRGLALEDVGELFRDPYPSPHRAQHFVRAREKARQKVQRESDRLLPKP